MKNIYKKLIFIFLLVTLLAPSLVAAQYLATTPLNPPTTAPGEGMLEKGISTLTSPGFIKSQILDATGNVVSFIIFWLSYFIGFIGSVVFAIGGVLLQIGLELNAGIIFSPIVRTGWLIMRDFANLAFVLAIIITAFATMLRYQPYGMKKMLTNLIVMALLVNFSLALAGIFIDASGVVSNFFLQKATPSGFGESAEFAENLASAFQVQKLQEVKDVTQMPKFKGIEDFSASMVGLLASVFFVTFFTIIGATVMIIISGLIVIRYVVLALLLILMPAVWVFSIFPQFKAVWNKWWDTFLQWLFFLPLTLFFLFLTILMAHNFQDSPNSLQQLAAQLQAQNAGTWNGLLLVIKNGFEIFAQMIVTLSMLVAGLITAKSVSGFGSNGVIKMASSFQGWATGKVKGGIRGGRIGRWSGRKIIGSKATQWTANKLAKVPGLRGASATLSNYISNSKARSKEEVAEYQKKNLANLSDEALMSRATNYTDIGQRLKQLGTIGQAAELNEFAKRGKLEDYLNNNPTTKDRILKSYIEAAKLAGTEKELLKSRPDLAKEFAKTGKKQDAIAKAIGKIKPKETVNLPKAVFKNLEVLANLKTNQLNEIGKGGLPEIKDFIKKTISDELSSPTNPTLTTKLQKVYNHINNPSWG